MGYQNVSSPRFFINVIEWLADSGIISPEIQPFRTLPVSFGGNSFVFDNIPPDIFNTQSFCAFLGHDFPLHHYMIYFSHPFTDDIVVNAGLWAYTENHLTATNDNGFSLRSFDGTGVNIMEVFPDTPTQGFTPWGTPSFGSAVIGTYYEMTKSANLSLTLSYDYGGTKEMIARNGATFSNTFYHRPPKWTNDSFDYQIGAWELDKFYFASTEFPSGAEQNLARSGRRTWDLRFSYLDDSDVWGSNQSVNYFRLDQSDTALLDDGDYTLGVYNYNILSDDNFFSQVWHKTLSGTLPFIFQPDKDNYNPDQFAIARFKQNSLKVTRSAFSVYDIFVSIEEVW